MFCLKEYKEPSASNKQTRSLDHYLPWAALVAPGVVLQKDRLLQQTIQFRGQDLASSSDSELISAVAKFNNALKRLGSGWTIFVEAQRRQCDNYPASTWPHVVPWLIECERQNAFQNDNQHFESQYFLTFVWQLPGDHNKRAQALFYDDPNQGQANDNERDLAYFQKQVAELTDIMRGVFVEVSALDDDQTLTYLHSCISTNQQTIKAPEVPMYLDSLLADQAFQPGDVPMLADHYMPTVSFSGFPATSLPGILDELNQQPIEYRWVTRFIALDKDDARKELEKYRKRWWQKRKNLWTLVKEEASKQESALLDSDAANKAMDADSALQELGDDLVAFGYFTCTVTVWHQDYQQAKQKIAAVKQVIQAKGFTVKDETLNSLDAWLGSLPGHVYANVRRPLINTLNLAHMIPLSAIWAGQKENEHLKKQVDVGAPHITCSTTGYTPFRLNLNVGDVGHTLIIGPTGAGKSTLLCILELQWLKYPNAQVIIFDKDRSARAATLAVNGHYYDPGSSQHGLNFQPLSKIDEPSERQWATQFISDLLTIQKIEVKPLLTKQIDQALQSLASDEVQHRTMTVFCDLVQNTEIREALRPYTLDGHLGSLFDGDNEQLTPHFWRLFEMGSLMNMGDEAIIPALNYLFHRIEQSFDGRPTLLVLDEAWLFLSHDIFMRRLQAWLKTLRKKNVYVVFATQEVADTADSPIMATILSACHTKIYLPDEEALTPNVTKTYQGFGLSDTEIHLLANAQKKRDYYYRSVHGRRLFDLNLGAVALAFAAMSSETDQKFLDDMIKNNDPKRYPTAILGYHGLDWAADLYEKSLHNHQGEYRCE